MTNNTTAKQIKLTLVRSKYHRIKKHRATLEALGLRRMHQSILVPDNAAMRGMINKIAYLLQIEEI